MSECGQNKPYVPLTSPFNGKISPYEDKEGIISGKQKPYSEKAGISPFEILGGCILQENCGFIITENRQSFISYE